MEMTLGQAMVEYLEQLKTDGKSERTIYTYTQDAKQITGFFGTDRKLSAILVPHVGKFLKSDALLKLPNGNERAEPHREKDGAGIADVLCVGAGYGIYRQAPTAQACPEQGRRGCAGGQKRR